MRSYCVALALLAALLGVSFRLVPVYAADDAGASAQRAVDWLRTQQQNDGAFPGFGPGTTADAIFALAALGINPNSVLKDGNSPLTYLATKAQSYAGESAAAAGKLILAVVAAGQDPASFGGQNLNSLLQQHYDVATGKYGDDPLDQSYALLALAAAGQPVPQEAQTAMGQYQLADGGWSFDGTPATGSDTNTSAVAVQALAAVGAQGDVLSKGMNYLKSQQNADGGFPYAKGSEFGSDTDANSTALVIQALVAAGEDPRALKQSGGDPIGALQALQNPSGAFRYQTAITDDNILATAQAIPALLLKPLPLQPLEFVYLPLLQTASVGAQAMR